MNLASPWFWREGKNWHGLLYCVAGQTDEGTLYAKRNQGMEFLGKNLEYLEVLSDLPLAGIRIVWHIPPHFTHRGLGIAFTRE